MRTYARFSVFVLPCIAFVSIASLVISFKIRRKKHVFKFHTFRILLWNFAVWYISIGNDYVLFCSSVDRCVFWGSILVIIMFCFAVVLTGVNCFVCFAVVLTGVICLQAGVPRGGDGGRELCGR